MLLASPFLAASSSNQHSHLSVFELLPIGVPISVSLHNLFRMAHSRYQWLCTSISDSTSSKASTRVKGCPCACVDESSSADEDEDSAFLALPPFLATLCLLFPDIASLHKQLINFQNTEHEISENGAYLCILQFWTVVSLQQYSTSDTLFLCSHNLPTRSTLLYCQCSTTNKHDK